MAAKRAHENGEKPPPFNIRSFFGRLTGPDATVPDEDNQDEGRRPTKWSMGVLNDTITHEVPGSVLLLTGERNAPLGLRNMPATTSHSSLPTSQFPSRTPSLDHRTSWQHSTPEDKKKKKKTKDGAIILEPQPEDSHNDPLNWPAWKRDSSLLSLGLYCMVGGGMTPILAAGFSNVAMTYDVTVPEVALTTGLYMMGLGLGSVFASPTAILYGKRPVYLFGAIMLIGTSCWCAASPSYNSLLVARIFQGIAVSPVECLPSATIAEIFFLHERAYRIGIYTLLLLGGKNLIPLVSAAIIQSMEWRWVFWIVAMVAGFCWVLLFLFVPETFWDRTPRPKHRGTTKKHSMTSFFHHKKPSENPEIQTDATADGSQKIPTLPKPVRNLHVGFAPDEQHEDSSTASDPSNEQKGGGPEEYPKSTPRTSTHMSPNAAILSPATHQNQDQIIPHDLERSSLASSNIIPSRHPEDQVINTDSASSITRPGPPQRYTTGLRERPRLTFVQQLKPWNGRLHHDNWFRVAMRPFILFAYPAVLWSSVVYSCSVGWLIVLSESVSVVYRDKLTYNFSALSTGLIYLSPFIGGVLGTAVAGKVSDVIVRAMAKRNGGLYEPEFRLVMAAPVAITTVIGLMGFGWSAEVHDAWIVPTIFFGIISFGCSLGSTTAITFCVDSYRQYAGEALVTLNFSKNIFHGLVFSLFFTKWLESDGSRMVFIWLGVIQLIFLMSTIPMFIFGKRARMWTVRMNFMEKF